MALKAEILAVGTELLLGDIVNTNAQFISKALAELGIDVYFQTVVGDNESRLYSAIETAFSRADIVISTGGLGPTSDDLTKETVAKYFNINLYLDETILSGIKCFFMKLNKEMTPSNKKQALVPEGAIILQNDKGTAPGLIVESEKKTVIMLPGPPVEAEHMFCNYAMPYLREKSGGVFVSRVLRLCGIGESAAEESVSDLVKNNNPSVASYAKNYETIFRITAGADSREAAEKMLNPVADEIYKRLGEYIYAEGETTLAQTVVNMLLEKNITISLAESCTGGMLAASFTDIPGVSSIFLEGAVTYSNEAKMKRLGVKSETLENFGAVSEQTAHEMACGIARTAGTDLGVGITGIAGPDGGTDDKPVGLVFIGVHYNGETSVRRFNFAGDRERIRKNTVILALNFIKSLI